MWLSSWCVQSRGPYLTSWLQESHRTGGPPALPFLLVISKGSSVPYSKSRAQVPDPGNCCGFYGCFNSLALPDRTEAELLL